MISLINSQKLWLKLQRRFLQYSAISLKQPQWLLMFTFSRIQIIRTLVLRLTKKPVQIDLLGENSVFSDLDPDRVVKALKSDGLHLGITIPPHLLEEILDFAKTATYYGNGDLRFPFSLANRKVQEIKFSRNFRIGYNFEPTSQCTAIRKLAMIGHYGKLQQNILIASPCLPALSYGGLLSTMRLLRDALKDFITFTTI